MASSSSRKFEGEQCVDRFSGLPDNVAHHILHFLDVEHLCPLMLASQRCRKLCLTVPHLNVDNREHTKDSATLNRYYFLVERFLDARQKINNLVRCLTFTWLYPVKRAVILRKRKVVHKDNDCRLGDDLYKKAILKCGVENLELNFISEEQPRVLPLLKLNKIVLNANCSVLHFPQIINSRYPILETLILHSVKFTPKSGFDHMIMQLRSLKVLHLIDCDGMELISLMSLSLQHFQFYQWLPRFAPFIVPTMSFSKEIAPPVWYGLPLGRLTFEKPVNLLHAEMLLSRRLFQGGSVEVSRTFLVPIMKRLGTVKSIKLESDTIELAYKEGVLPLPFSFETEKLAIENSLWTDTEVAAIASILQGTPNLKSLVVTSSVPGGLVERCGSKMKEFWETQGLKLLHLKSAVIQVLGDGNGYEFVKFLLKHARGLECLNILCEGDLQASILEQIMG